MSLESLYQELILQHYRSPKNRGSLVPADVEVSMSNPLCGDEITFSLRLTPENTIEARFEGMGCSISQASASMMSERIEGLTLGQARIVADRFRELVRGDAEAAADRQLGDLRALSGVAKYPVRVRCAMLAWNAFEEAGQRLTRDESEGSLREEC